MPGADRRNTERAATASRLLLGVALALWAVQPAGALVVHGPNDTTVNPAEYPGWENGDPGWNNHTSSGQDYVYLGDSWVLQALHTGVPTLAHFGGQSFTPIPGQSFVVPNPPGRGLSATTDLRLFRINGDPGLPPLTIASQPVPVGAEVVMIAQGQPRQDEMTHWQVDTSDDENWIWTEVATGGNFHGYKSFSGTREKRWGTNRIAHANTVLSGSQPNVTGVVALGTESNPRHIVSLFTKFDETGGTAFEAQAVTGDSGGSVFYQRDGQWELIGIMNAVLLYDNQSKSRAIFGNATSFADLATYHDAITSIMETNAAYSILGDINLDGQVTGDGTGPPELDDVSAFVQGWMYDNGRGVGDITSWQKGDLNRDGKVDVDDFLLLRQALNGAMSAGAVAALLPGISFVPEPSSAVLFFLGAWWIALAQRRRHPR